jgi:hypothetical protein
MSDQKNQEQSWWNCKYAVGVIGNNGIPSYALDESKLYDIRGCGNKEMLKSDGCTPMVVWFQYRSDRSFSEEIAALCPIVVCEKCEHYKLK